MEQNKFYILVTKIDGITYRLHNNGKFYWNVMNGGIKTYKPFTNAIKQANRFARRLNNAVSVLSLTDGQYLNEASHIATTLGEG